MFGALIGDSVGSEFEGSYSVDYDFEYRDYNIRYTDDTILTFAVAEILHHKKWNDKNFIVSTFKKWGNSYPWAGYGASFLNWLISESSEPYNSCGNGSAMRVSPCGWYGKDENEVIEMATKVTEVTHNHPEGIKGAVVTALCIYYARIGKSKEFIGDYIKKNYDINFNYEELKKAFPSAPIICQFTVPAALYCFMISDSFEDCLRKTIALGGDTDTAAAISCSIAEAYYKVLPKNMLYDCIVKLDYKKDCDIETLLDDHIAQLKENNVVLK